MKLVVWKNILGVQMLSKTPSLKWRRFLTQFGPLNCLFKRRASYHFKTQEFRNLRAFEFFYFSSNEVLNSVCNKSSDNLGPLFGLLGSVPLSIILFYLFWKCGLSKLLCKTNFCRKKPKKQQGEEIQWL